jgi:type IV pilus assembly protein PilC
MLYKYTAKDVKGKKISSVMQANSVAAVLTHLKLEGFLPLKVNEVQSFKYELPIPILSERKRVKSKEVAIFTRQLAAILSAGLLLTDALDAVSDELENEYFRQMIKKIRHDIHGGADFSTALAKYPHVFTVSYVSIVKSGEATGQLDETMTNLAKYLEYNESMKEKIKNAISYPLFILGFAMFVVMIVVLFLIPKFKDMFAQANAELPWLTRVVVGISEFALHNIFQIFIVLFLAMLGLVSLFRFGKIRYVLDSLKLNVPIFGRALIQKYFVARFCRTLGVLLSGGVNVATSLQITSQVVNQSQIVKAIEHIKQRILGGGTFADGIRSQKVFPRLVAKMVSVGERTGRVDEMLIKTADYYDEEFENTLHKLTVLIEPIMIIFIGVFIGIVVIALYLPIFQASRLIN